MLNSGCSFPFTRGPHSRPYGCQEDFRCAFRSLRGRLPNDHIRSRVHLVTRHKTLFQLCVLCFYSHYSACNICEEKIERMSVPRFRSYLVFVRKQNRGIRSVSLSYDPDFVRISKTVTFWNIVGTEQSFFMIDRPVIRLLIFLTEIAPITIAMPKNAMHTEFFKAIGFLHFSLNSFCGNKFPDLYLIHAFAVSPYLLPKREYRSCAPL